MAITLMAEYMRTYSFLPGQIENWVFVMNTEKMKFANAKLSILQDLFGFLALMFKGTTR